MAFASGSAHARSPLRFRVIDDGLEHQIVLSADAGYSKAASTAFIGLSDLLVFPIWEFASDEEGGRG